MRGGGRASWVKLQRFSSSVLDLLYGRRKGDPGGLENVPASHGKPGWTSRSRIDRIFNLLASLNLLEIRTMPQTKHPNDREPIRRSAADRIHSRQTRAWPSRTAPVMTWRLTFALGCVLAPHAGAQDKLPHRWSRRLAHGRRDPAVPVADVRRRPSPCVRKTELCKSGSEACDAGGSAQKDTRGRWQRPANVGETTSAPADVVDLWWSVVANDCCASRSR
jgi:hypothetical protein